MCECKFLFSTSEVFNVSLNISTGIFKNSCSECKAIGKLKGFVVYVYSHMNDCSRTYPETKGHNQTVVTYNFLIYSNVFLENFNMSFANVERKKNLVSQMT